MNEALLRARRAWGRQILRRHRQRGFAITSDLHVDVDVDWITELVPLPADEHRREAVEERARLHRPRK